MIASIYHADTYLTADGVMIDYEVAGTGDSFVLLHSGMMSREDMRTQIAYFSDSYKVIAIDAREQGRSSASENLISYELMASDVVGVLDSLGIDKTHIFGQSDGGITALMVAHLYPDRLDKLIIHGAVYNFEGYPADQRNGWLNLTWDADDEEAIDPNGFPGMAIRHYLLGRENLDDFETHLREMATMWATSPNLSTEDLNSISISTLVIVGDHYDVSIRHTLEMHESLSNSQLFVVPGATHFIHQEKPDLLHVVIQDFLDE
ncbi:MAG: alpha/beta fold hydrolase [Pseudomonadales bacterium]|nr:alpha/beta fold hydrolase [Pseudomonadales bacterium]